MKSADLICDGNQSVFVDMENGKDQKFDFERIVGETDHEKLLSETSNESQLDQLFEESIIDNTIKSLIILIKFFNDMVMYYKELPGTLRSAHVTEPDLTSI